ncbi:unnamed protein product [Blepharisma stoltei]|uniref:Tubby C-terminal domain-containing protein n=1 Tax=Blepharisma stoltei TaxID=1481888 RepID=A0AAU9K3T0_9CILI|nr:unnamed protein product [Blepharisma stoltei]
MFQREYLEDSDSFSDPEEPGTPPYYQQPADSFMPAQIDRDFEYEEKPRYQNLQPVEQSHFYTNPPPPTYYPPQPSEFVTSGYVIDGMGGPKQTFQPVKKENSEKIGFVNYEEPERQEPRPDTSSARPGSSNAQMRAKMLEMQRNKLISRGSSGTTQVQSSNMFMPGVSSMVAQGLEQQSGIGSYLYSNQIFNEKDLNANRDLRGFTAPKNFAYEPGPIKAKQTDNLPAPIKADRTVFKADDELEEVKLDEGSRHTPSKTLQGIHKQLEESKNPPPAPYERPNDGQFTQPDTRATTATEKFVPAEPKYVPFDAAKPVSISEQAIPQAPKQPVQETQPDRYQNERTPTNEPNRQRQSIDDKPPQREEQRPAQIEKPTPDGNRQPEGKRQDERQEPPAPTHPLNRPDSARQQQIPRQPNINVREVLAQEMTDMKKFLTNPIPRGIMLQCNIRREKAGFGRLYPKYYLHISDGMTFLLAGKKRGGNRTSNYMITSNQKEFSVKSPSYLGKVRSNFIGTEFHLFDTGINPKHKGANPMNAREELGIVLYQSNILGSKGPRKMRVLIPAVNNAGDHYVWKPMNKDDGMLKQYNAGNTSGMFCFFNKPPKWNEHVQAFVLNFNGRVDRASVKNFQLIDDRDENKVYMQFGRVGDQNFNMDFQWPFSPLQAFGVALSSFDYKFACE